MLRLRTEGTLGAVASPTVGLPPPLAGCAGKVFTREPKEEENRKILLFGREGDQQPDPSLGGQRMKTPPLTRRETGQPRCGARLCARRLCPPPPPLCDIPSGCCFFTGPWTVTPSSLRMLRRVAAFCWPLRPVLLLVSFPRSRSPVVGVLGLCWMWRGVPSALLAPTPRHLGAQLHLNLRPQQPDPPDALLDEFPTPQPPCLHGTSPRQMVDEEAVIGR